MDNDGATLLPFGPALPNTETRRKPRRPGPYSRDDAIASADRRTKAGKVLRSVTDQLTADVGGDPTTGERLLIQSIAVKATRLSLLTAKLLDVADLGEDGHHALSWLNSMRQDISTLGIKRRARDVGLPGDRSTLRERAHGVQIDATAAPVEAAAA